MLTLRLSRETERRLAALARRTGRTKSGLAREAILRHLEDLADRELAQQRRARNAKGIPLEQLDSEIS